jgi:hypothetical protein
MIESGAPLDGCGASKVPAPTLIGVDDCSQHRKIAGVPSAFGHTCSIASGTDAQGLCGVLMPSTPFGVSAGRVTSFRVVSRNQIQCFRRSS